jgi:membrane fusion protein (multidrug efflux system)
MSINEDSAARGGAETHTHYHLHLERGTGDDLREPASGDRSSEAGGKEGDNNNERSGDRTKDRTKDKEDEKEGGEPKKVKSKKPLIILAVVVVVVAIVAFVYWFAKRNQLSTDDAYTDGNAITMAPKVSGYVVALYINDNSHVKKGDLLLRIEQDDYGATQTADRAAVASAQSQLEAARVAYEIAKVQYPAQLSSAEAQQRSAEASLAQAQLTYKRQHEVDQRATTQENIDAANSQSVAARSSVANAKAQVAVAKLVPEQLRQAAATVHEREASLDQAVAQLKQADLNFGYTEIRAPSDGFITKRNVQLGSYLSAGTTMFLIVTPDVWVTANYKESQLGRIRLGDAVDLKVDAYPDLKLEGHVQSIQYGSGSVFSAFPVENATGNYVKIVQRVPVKIVIDRGLDPNRPLPLGLSVSPVVHVR